MSLHTNREQLSFLVPLDGSRLAEAALPAVEVLSERCQAKVTLLHIMETKPPATIHGEPHLVVSTEAQSYLEGLAQRLRKAGVDVEVHVHEDKEGNVAHSIVSHAQEMKTNLVIMCAHGRGGLRGLLFGRIAQQALRRGTVSILLIHPRDDGSPAAFDLQHILVPLDGTAEHEPALSAAKILARIFNAEMHLVFVIPTLATLSGEQAVSGLLLPTTMRAVLDLAEQGAVDYLEQTASQCRAEGIAVNITVLRGDAVPSVLTLAQRLNIDLIVMASHGRAGLEALLTGSVAQRILGKINRPLLLVRAGSGSSKDTRT